MIPDCIRDQSLQTTPEIFIGFIIVPGLVWYVPNRFFGFQQLPVNDTGIINESKFAYMMVDSPGWNASYEVSVIDNAIVLNPVLIPEIAVTNSG